LFSKDIFFAETAYESALKANYRRQ